MRLAEPYLQGTLWSSVTIATYILVRFLYARFRAWWLSPILAGPAILMLIATATRTTYARYIAGTHWLVLLLGPVTVAFAVPIFEHRVLIRRNWAIFAIGILTGCTVAFLSSWMLASLLGLDSSITLSLLPRSMSTPFAMTVSKNIGGVPELTAVFTACTGVLGVAIGELLLKWVPLRTGFARGALLGMGAHGAGVAMALQLGTEEASSAGLVMVLVGVINVLISPLIAKLLAMTAFPPALR